MTTTAPSTDDLDLDRLRAVAAKGAAAAEALAAAELARQEARTAELAAQQREYDADVLRRARQVDDDLTREQRDALADLQSAVDEGDLASALAAWRREAAARYAQRHWRAAWRDVHARTGEGQVPPVESTRDAERDEAACFLPALARAAEVGAREDADATAELLVGERPTALPGELVPGPEADILHAPSCPDPSRTETTRPPVGRESQGTVVRCMSCAASVLVHLPRPSPRTPWPPRPARSCCAARTLASSPRATGGWRDDDRRARPRRRRQLSALAQERRRDDRRGADAARSAAGADARRHLVRDGPRARRAGWHLRRTA